MATFVFSIVTLAAVRAADGDESSFTPVFSTAGVAVLVLATVVAFLVFANGTATLLRVQYLVERIADETRPALLVAFPEEVAAAAPPSPGDDAGVAVVARTHGVIDAVDVGALAIFGREIDGRIEMSAPVGSYVGLATPIAVVRGRVLPSDLDTLSDRILGCVLLTNERTLLQDPGFGLRQLVDIASRALSPSVNDPTTAVQVVDRIADLLGRIVDRPDPTGWHADASGAIRVFVPPESFAALVTLGFAEIIRFGADSPQITRRVRTALDALGARVSGERRAEVERIRALLDAAIDESSPRAFQTLASGSDPRGLG